MAKTTRPRRNKARVDRYRANIERMLNTPWPEPVATEDELYRSARKLGITRKMPERK